MGFIAIYFTLVFFSFGLGFYSKENEPRSAITVNKFMILLCIDGFSYQVYVQKFP
jgi:predicted AlkP superfamily pyrophosphatase or phosphodiesterase